jgi:signal transduction histidine kinase
MDRLIADLLHFASAREARLELTDVDLRALADEVVQARQSQTTADPAVPPAEISIGPLPRVRADAAMVRQMLDNLVGNSFKYALPGRPVQLEITAEMGAEGWAEITVADRGIGIPAGEHDAVFTGFHRAHHNVLPAGSGLGLTICRRITDRHGGTITAQENSGGGTRITFTLPAAL